MTVKERVWQLAQEMKEANGGEPVRPLDLVRRAEEEGLHAPTVRTKYSEWLKAGGAPFPPSVIGRPRNEIKINATTDYAKAKADKERALADLRMMEVDVKRGELLEVAEVEQASSRAFHLVREALLSLPDTLERRAGLRPDQIELTENVIHAAMQRLQDDLSKIGSRS